MGELMWQDFVFSLSGLFFAASLVPSLRNPQTVVPRNSSVPTAACCWLVLVPQVSLGLYWAAGAGALLASLWTAVAIVRAPRAS